MTLIKSISGIRGTIGGRVGEGLSPLDVVKFTSAYGTWLQQEAKKKDLTVVIGRDARISGPMVESLVLATLQGLGINVIHLGLSTTPTVELAVMHEKADGGIILTASHNPKQWNALKLLNGKGEFVSGEDGARILSIAEAEDFNFADVDDLGSYELKTDWIEKHIQLIAELDLVDFELVKEKKFKVAVDAVNSTGGISIPPLLEAMGCEVVPLYTEPTGHFPHNPEPLKEHLTEICELVKAEGCDLGIVVDPDVDRLALIDEEGEMFGEEYTLVAVADYILQNTPGPTVSNLSSSLALKDVTEAHGCTYSPSAVGEVNVVVEMKRVNATIGGEGNGGIIYPELHYGRDALVGIALVLTYMAKVDKSLATLKSSYPQYFMAKEKIALDPTMDVDGILEQMKEKYASENPITIDGVKIIFNREWVHLRKSNTEPIIRIYTESTSLEKAKELAHRIMDEIRSL